MLDSDVVKDIAVLCTKLFTVTWSEGRSTHDYVVLDLQLILHEPSLAHGCAMSQNCIDVVEFRGSSRSMPVQCKRVADCLKLPPFEQNQQGRNVVVPLSRRDGADRSGVKD